MNATIPFSPRGLAAGLAAFLSPTIFFLLLVLADRLHFPAAPDFLVAAFFYLIPPVALLICGAVVWSSHLTPARKLRWMLATLAAMLIQFGLLLALLVAATGYSPS